MARFVFAVPASIALAGCGGLLDDGAGFEEAFAASIDLFDEVSALSKTEVSDMPTTDTATYRGWAGFGSFNPLVLGEMTVEADFDGGTLDGDISNLVNGDDEAVSGGGTITGTFVGADISGVLNGSGTSDGDTFTITDQPMTGEFRGDAAEAMLLVFSGTVDSDDFGPLPLAGEGYGTR